MQNLLIEQRGPSGLLKTWRVRPDQKALSFGGSKFAELRSPLEGIKGIQGIFEYREKTWFYVNLDVRTQEVEKSADLCLDRPMEIRMGTTTLSIFPMETKQALFQNLENCDFLKPGADKKPFQLITTHHREQLMESFILPLGKTFFSKFDSTSMKFSTQQSEDWARVHVGELEISQRTIYLTSDEALRVVPRSQLIDEGGKKTLYSTLAGATLLALLFLLSPNTKPIEEVAMSEVPPQEYREVKMPPMKKKKQTASAEKPKPQQAKQVPQPVEEPKAAAGPIAPAGGKKMANAIKALGESRISKLIGKISAGAAKSANVVISQGVLAGSGPTGRALAAVGSVTQSGKDWTGDGKGQGVKIGTVGHGGGGTAKGLGGIAGGKAGSGGVGLLEEDGEVTGGLDREVIAAFIRGKLGEILYCYERQLSAQPDLYGKVAVKFTISGSGAVEVQRVGESTLKNATVEGCILQKVGKWKFPTPEGGTKVLVTYPFLFKSTN